MPPEIYLKPEVLEAFIASFTGSSPHGHIQSVGALGPGEPVPPGDRDQCLDRGRKSVAPARAADSGRHQSG